MKKLVPILLGLLCLPAHAADNAQELERERKFTASNLVYRILLEQNYIATPEFLRDLNTTPHCKVESSDILDSRLTGTLTCYAEKGGASLFTVTYAAQVTATVPLQRVKNSRYASCPVDGKYYQHIQGIGYIITCNEMDDRTATIYGLIIALPINMLPPGNPDDTYDIDNFEVEIPLP